ncbi:nuclear receptor coactivator 7 isoform X2 [Panulirus ornatus]|uniref:nuclear receptor coactivator 7 isoform X2 n=1 Tax=Panulirus ornatus TaxID=150431 RepID=UPI003A8A6DE0
MNGPTELDIGVLETLREGDDSPEELVTPTQPVVLLEGVSEVPCWNNTPPQVCITNWSTASGPSSGTCSPHSRSPSLISVYSDLSWGDGLITSATDDTRSLSNSSLEPNHRRFRHSSTSVAHCPGSNEQKLAAARLCASQEHLGQEGDPTKRKHSLKSMFLDMFHPESGRRMRSSSNIEDRQRSPSQGESAVKKLISKIRSRSHSDLLDSKSRSSSCSSVDRYAEQKEAEVSLNPKVKVRDVRTEDAVPATAINTRLVGRYRKHIAIQKKRRWSAFEQHVLKSRGQRPEGISEDSVPLGYVQEGEGPGRWVVTLETTGETSTDKGKEPTDAADDDDHHHPPRDLTHQKRLLSRTRSNSESAILALEKKRKRSFLPKDSRVINRLRDFHRNKKNQTTRGSLPTLLVEKQVGGYPQADHPNAEPKLRKSSEEILNQENLSVPHYAEDDHNNRTSRAQSLAQPDGVCGRGLLRPGDRPQVLRGRRGLGAHPEAQRQENLSPYLNEGHSRNRRHRFSIDHLWSVFRGRRLSHDVGAAGRHVTETVVPWLRGKSRSVDHSIYNPFDIDALRRKIGERTSSEPSRDIPSPSSEATDGSKENISPSEKKMGGRSQPILHTMTYTVSANDTLTSIAARFDTTPSELTKLNKLSTRYVYPGQVIAVPDKLTSLDDKASEGHQDSIEESNGQDPLTHIRPPSPNQRGDLRSPVSPHTYPRTPANSVEIEKSLDRECLEKVLKISVRHITDGQGVVAGVLLVTPNAVMFDPNVSDPLVIEHGPESYGVIAPMEYVVNAALYYDIAHMRVKDTNLPKPEIPKPEIYWGPSHVERTGSQESPGKDASLSKDATFPELAASQDDNDSSCSCGGDTRESSAFPKAFDHELLTPIGSDVSPASAEGQPSSGQPSPSGQQQQTVPVAGDLTPIVEASRLEDTQATPPNLAQTQCDNTPAQDLAQTDWTSPSSQIADDAMCNEKKRTTSVTFDLTGEGDESMPDLGIEAGMQESRKQKWVSQSRLWRTEKSCSSATPQKFTQTHTRTASKPLNALRSSQSEVLKRLSYPLSWMESFNTDKESIPQHHTVHPSSAPPGGGIGGNPTTDGPDGNRAGMFSNVFSMSNVSSMLSSSPKYLVDFSSGLFARSPSDSTSSVRDVTELGTPPGSLEGYRVSHSVFYRKQSSLGSDKEERKGIPIFHPGRPSMDFTRRPANQQPLTVSTHQTPPLTSGIPASAVNQLSSQQQQAPPTTAGSTLAANQQAQKRAQYKEGPKFGLKSMVSMDDMPELFASFDKLIPKPATSCEDPPLYLCLRMGKPDGKSIPKSTPVMSYGKKRMRPEYWFSIPKNRSDELFNFFQLWAHVIYGELNEDEVASRGFILVEEDTELWDDEEPGGGENEDGIGELTEMTKESWEKIKAPYVKLYSLMKSQMTISTESENPEVVSMSEELRRALYSSNSLTSLDLEAFLPDVVGTSEIITDHVRKSLYKKLPARAQGYAWKLVFSTSQHGFSLNSLYRKMGEVETPIMLFIQDTHQNVFGAVVSCSLHVSELYYGTGESFLFSFHPEFQVFPWTGENTFFVKGNNESLIVGGGDGNFGLWLDGDLYQGRTQSCKTFDNPQLTDTEDFIIKSVECWCFE